MKMKKNYSKILILSVCACISLAMLLINERYLKGLDAVFYNLTLTIAVTIFATALISFITDKFSANNVEEILNRNLLGLKECRTYGLIGIYDSFPLTNEDIKKDFINSKKVYIVMNDGKAFISSNTLLLKERIAKKEASTTFILQDYGASDTMSALTRKNGHDENQNYYVNKIKDLIEYHIKSLFKMKDERHDIALFLNKNYNTLAIILTDHYALVSTYRIAPGKTRVPHFVFQQGGIEYDDTLEDVKKIIEISREIPLAEGAAAQPRIRSCTLDPNI